MAGQQQMGVLLGASEKKKGDSNYKNINKRNRRGSAFACIDYTDFVFNFRRSREMREHIMQLCASMEIVVFGFRDAVFKICFFHYCAHSV